MFLILAFTPGPLNSRRDTFKVYLKPILGMCFFWMCFLGCAPRYEIWSIEQKLWEYPFKPPSDTPRSRWGPGVGRRWWLEQGVEKDSTANCHLGEMTTTLNKFNASVISFEHFSLVILWKCLSDFTSEFANPVWLPTLGRLRVKFGEHFNFHLGRLQHILYFTTKLYCKLFLALVYFSKTTIKKIWKY